MSSHIHDATKALATPLCGATSGVCVDSDRALCPDCRRRARSEPDLIGGRANVVTLCGSTRFKDEFMAVNQRLTMGGSVVISLGVFGHTDLPDYDWTTDASDLKRTLDRLHFQKIDMADEVYVVNPGGYIGESTQREIAYAVSKGKRIRYQVAPVVARPAPQTEGDRDHETD